MVRLHRMLILKACPYQQILSSKGAETTNGTASQHIHINKYVDLPDGSTTQIVDSGPLFTFLVIPKQQNGTRVLYEQAGHVDNRRRIFGSVGRFFESVRPTMHNVYSLPP